MASRRQFLRSSGAGVAVLIGAAGAGIPEIALAQASSSKPSDRWELVPFTPASLGNWPSDVDQHLALYEGYVKKANELQDRIANADRDPAKQSVIYSELRGLKVEYSFAVGGVKNHEIFFGHQMAKPKEGNVPTGKVKQAIERHFGSVASWEADLRATGISARGWVWLAWDRDRKTLFNYIGDSQNAYPIWNAVPLVALDMFEHAFFKDYGRNRGAYISDFLPRINWEVVESRFAEVS
jgi:Fe-Mn family superoxide dismutase